MYLPIHKICALCGIFSSISVILTTENFDLRWPWNRSPVGSRSLKVTPVNSSVNFIFPFSHQLYPRPYLVLFMRYPSIGSSPSLYFATLLRLTSQTEAFPWDDLRKILHGCQRMATVHNDEEMLPKVSTLWVGRANVIDDRQTTDRRQTDLRCDSIYLTVT